MGTYSSFHQKPTPDSQKHAKHLLVACDRIVLSGGLLRFDRLGVILRKWGHTLAFTCFSSEAPCMQLQSPIISLNRAFKMKWDAIMIPGAGFPDNTISRFSIFRNDNFGVRVQFILNDQSLRYHFLAVNNSFRPHIVIFNNTQWPSGSFTDFTADSFFVLLGAVDTQLFAPKDTRSYPLNSDFWIIGGQTAKNPEPLIDALRYLSSSVRLLLFGVKNQLLVEKYRSLIDSSHLVLVGPLTDDKTLSDFYHGVDCIVMTETNAGWSNLVAEAMASGVPVICTCHGTTPFAKHEETALICSTPTPLNIANALNRIIENPALGIRLANKARTIIAMYPWDDYAQKLLNLIWPDEICELR
jgi:glycosyltransferase involved in cell wall biosynthesis